MDDRATHDPILTRFRSALAAMYGERLERIVLFGSRARGDFRPDSDYDIAVFLKEPCDIRRERHRMADLRVDFLDGAGAFLDAKPFPIAAHRDRTPLMHEIRRDGVDL